MVKRLLRWDCIDAMVGLSVTLARLLAIIVAVEAVALKCLIKVEGPGFESSLPASK